MKMFKVIEKQIPVYKNILSREVIGERTVYQVIDEAGEESWQCELKVTAEMFAASKNEDMKDGGHREAELNSWLNAERFADEDELLEGTF
jgi:hypothetical protein